MEEKRVRFVCELLGWKYEKDGNSVVLSIRSTRFCHQDKNRNRPVENFEYKVYSASFEDVHANICGADRDFDPSEYAFYLQNEYIEKNPEMVVPPVLSITKFAEFVEEKLNLLDVSLSANLATDSFENKIIELADRNGFDVFIIHNTMNDCFQFWKDEKRLESYVEKEFDKNGYLNSGDQKRAKALVERLLYDIYDADNYVFSERKDENEKKAWENITELGREISSDIVKEFGIEMNIPKPKDDDDVYFEDDLMDEF